MNCLLATQLETYSKHKSPTSLFMIDSLDLHPYLPLSLGPQYIDTVLKPTKKMDKLIRDEPIIGVWRVGVSS